MAENTEDRLRAVRDDIGGRIGWAAKNDDSEAVRLFIDLTNAIDAVLARFGEPKMSNFENLRLHATDAREALAKVAPPSDADPASSGGLYYPLLFLTQTVEDTLRAVLKRAHDEMRPENEAAAQWIAEARASAAGVSAPQEGTPHG